MASIGALMKLTVAFLSLVILCDPAFAQSGVSNQRDMYGNLVRDSGKTSAGVNQSIPNNGAIRNTPVQSPTNPISPSKSQQINRLGGGTN
jgi:Zn-dependent membrane protease YugP